MGYAKHVGRVGALAVALGIGTAVASTPGVAWADTGSSNTVVSPPAAGTAPSSGDATPSVTTSTSPNVGGDSGPTNTTTTGSSTNTTTTTATTVTGTQSTTTIGGGDGAAGVINAQTAVGDHTVDAGTSSATPPPSPKTTVTPKKGKTGSVAHRGTALNSAPQVPTHVSLTASGSQVSASSGSIAATHAQPQGNGTSLTAAVGGGSVTTGSTTVPQDHAAELQAAPELTAAPTSAVTSILTSLFAPLLPGAPVDSPLLWTLLAAARRQLGSSPTSDATVPAEATDTSGQDADPSAARMSTLAAVAANAAPTATVTQGKPSSSTGKITGTVKAVDPEGDPLTYSTANTSKGTVTVTTKGAFTYTPTATARHGAAALTATAADKADTFTITVSDGTGNTTAVPVTVTITPANNAPATKATVGKADPLSGVVTGSILDKDGDPLTFTTTAAPTNGGTIAYHTDGTFTYTPTPAARAAARTAGKIGTDKFTATVDDGHGGIKTVNVSVTIAPTDTAPVPGTPVLGAPAASNGAIKGTLTATDPENDKLTFGGSAKTTKGKVSVSSSGVFTYTPTTAARHAAAADSATAADKTDTFTVTVTDKYGATTTVPVTVTVLGRNSAPTRGKATVSQPDPVTGVVTGTLTATDADKDTVQYGGTATTAKGTVVVNANGTFTYTPTATARAAAAQPGAAAADKADMFTLAADDGHGAILSIAVIVTISPKAHTAPTAADDAYSTAEDTTLTVVPRNGVLGNDADPDGYPMTATVVTNPTSGTLVLNTDGSFTYTPNPDANGADSFTYRVADAVSAGSTATVSITVTPVNDPPVAHPTVDAPSATQGAVDGAVGAQDVDGDQLTYSVSTQAASGGVELRPDGTFTYTPTAAARHQAAATNATVADKKDAFTVTVDDGHGGTVSVPVTVTVGGADASPVNGLAAVGSPNPSTGVVTGSVTATDADDDMLTYGGTQATAKGSVTVNANGTFTYTPIAAARHQAAASNATAADKQDTFTVSVDDGHGGTLSVPVMVTIGGASNTNPVNPSVTVGAPDPTTGVVTGTATATDADNDALAYSGTQTTAKGSVTVNANGTFTYTPTAGARHQAAATNATAADKQDAFTVSVTDGHGGTLTMPVTVIVGGANATPVNGSATAGSPNQSTGAVTGTVRATDADNDTLAYSGTQTTAKGSVTVNANGTFTYTPTAGARHQAAATDATAADKQDTFTVTITDGHTGTLSVPVTVAVGAANNAPTVTTSSGEFNNGADHGTISATDADGDSITYAVTANGTMGAVTVNPTTGAYTYTATAAARSAAAGTPGSDVDTFTVSVDDGHGTPVTRTVTVEVMPTGVVADLKTGTSIKTAFSPGQPRTVLLDTTYDSTAKEYNTTVTVLDNYRGTRVGTPVTVVGSATDIEFNTDGSRAVVITSASNGDTVYTLLDTSTGARVGNASLRMRSSYVQQFAFDSDGVYFKATSGGSDTTQFGVITGSGATSVTLNGDAGLNDLLITPDGTRIVATTNHYNQYGTSVDSQIAVVNVATGGILGGIRTVTGERNTIAQLSPDGSRAYVTTYDATTGAYGRTNVNVYTTSNGIFTAAVPTSGRPVIGEGVQFSPDGSYFAVTSYYDAAGQGADSTFVTTLTVAGGQVGGGQVQMAGLAHGAAQWRADGKRLFQVVDVPASVPGGYGIQVDTIDPIANTVGGSAVQPGYTYGGLVFSRDRTRALLTIIGYDQTTFSIGRLNPTTGALTVDIGPITGDPEDTGILDGGRTYQNGTAYDSFDRTEQPIFTLDHSRALQLFRVEKYVAATDSYDYTDYLAVIQADNGTLRGAPLVVASGNRPANQGGSIPTVQLTGDGTHVLITATPTSSTSQISLVDADFGTRTGTTAILSGGFPYSRTTALYGPAVAFTGYSSSSSTYQYVVVNTANGHVTSGTSANRVGVTLNEDGTQAAITTTAYGSSGYTTTVTVVDTATGATVGTYSYAGTATVGYSSNGLMVSTPGSGGVRLTQIG